MARGGARSCSLEPRALSASRVEPAQPCRPEKPSGKPTPLLPTAPNFRAPSGSPGRGEGRLRRGGGPQSPSTSRSAERDPMKQRDHEPGLGLCGRHTNPSDVGSSGGSEHKRESGGLQAADPTAGPRPPVPVSSGHVLRSWVEPDRKAPRAWFLFMELWGLGCPLPTPLWGPHSRELPCSGSSP